MSDDPALPGPQDGDIDVEVIVPDPLSAGVYANGFTCWYNRTDFTVDFLVYLPAEPAAAAPHGPVMQQPVQVTARVKFAPSLIFQLMRTLEEAMSNYEHQFGHITSLGD